MMKTITQILLLCLLIATGASCQEARTVKVQVTEESGTPIEDAHVSVWYMGFRPGESKEVAGNTNKKGVFLAKGVPLLRMEAFISKEGYYKSESGRLSRKKDHAITLVLRRIKNPIPLYAKRLHIIPPVKDRDIGFDLQLADWVKPYGLGKQTDIIFNLHFRKKDFWTLDYRLTVTFPNKFDGIQQFRRNKYSKFQSPYLAPEKGYLSQWIQTGKRRGKNTKLIRNNDPRRGHWIRVRTKADLKGNILSANYVKVYGDFPSFNYYLNPTPNDRNLEFDTTKNLFKKFKIGEHVIAP